MTHTEHQLANGLRIVFQETDAPVGHCALLIDAGSRDEQPEEHGMAHFIEHNLFKGTKKRKAYHVLSRLDDVGGELNAYTTKEETTIHTSFLAIHFARAIELMADILLNSTFPEKELKKEKDVILDEIHAYLDSPGESIFDDFEDLVFAGHPMGRSILGTEESLQSFNKKKILAFIGRNYHPSQMVLSISGHIKWPKLLRILEQNFAALAPHGAPKTRTAVAPYVPQYIEEQKETMQSHAIIGGRSYGQHHPHFTAMILLNNLLGGPAMNSRLNLNIREKYGFAYNIESFYSPYDDSGVFGVYIGTNKNSLKRSITLIHKELQTLRDKKLGTLQLSKAKTQMIGHVALAQENNLALTIALGKSLLNYNRIDTLADVHKKIAAITPEIILEVANQNFDPTLLSTIIYKSKEN